MNFFENLNFSSSNEDGESEVAALAGSRRILCLTGSGTRPLDILMSDADEVVAVDVNPAQNALLALKVAAIQRLGYAEYLAFLGIAPSPDRLATYARLRDLLSPELRQHWDQRGSIVKSGVWHAGKWERLLKWNARFLRLFRGRAIRALMAAATVEDQSRLWQENFSDSRLRRSIEMIGRDWIWRWVIREPAGEFLPSPRDVGERLAADFARAAATFLFRDSDFAVLIFQGRHAAGDAMPLHLRPETYARLRERLPALRIVTQGLAELSAADLGRFDGFSLSDFGSYTGLKVYAACWTGILSTAAPAARFCERIFMNDLALPFPSLVEDPDLSDRLSRTDKAIIYRVRAGHIVP